MGETSQEFHFKIGDRPRDEFVALCTEILGEGFCVSPVDREWISVAAAPSHSKSLWAEQLSEQSEFLLCKTWVADSIDSWGEDLFESGDWKQIISVDGQERTMDGDSVLPENYRYLRYRYQTGFGVVRTSYFELGPAGCFAAAKEGEIEVLVGFAFEFPEAAFYWLNVAADFGHDTEDWLYDVVHNTDLDHYWEEVEPSLRIELISDYATGRSLPKNLDLAAQHLREFLDSGNHTMLDQLENLGKKEPEFRVIVERLIGLRPFWETRQRLRRIERLHELNAPKVILQNELETFRDAISKMSEVLDLTGPNSN